MLNLVATWNLVFSAALLLAPATDAPEFELATTGGETFKGQLAEVSADYVALQTATGVKRVASSQVLELRAGSTVANAGPKPTAWVELTDGSLLLGSDFRVEKNQAEMKPSVNNKLKLSTRAIATVRFQAPNAKLAEQWAELLKAPRSGDVIVVRKRDAIDYLSGVLGNVNDETVQFEADGEDFPVKRTKVEGLIYAHSPGAETAGSFCTLLTADGSSLQAKSIAIDGRELRVTTSAGIELNWPLSSIARIQFKVQYLSDLAPESAARNPLFGSAAEATPSAQAFFRPRFNASLEPGEIRLGGKSYGKGLALYGGSQVVFRLPERFSRFQALAGIDDAVRPEGKVKLIVMGDERPLLEARITGSDKPQLLDVDIRGVKRLTILVDFDGDEVADHLDLCDARILK
jgi:hypothetical protein